MSIKGAPGPVLVTKEEFWTYLPADEPVEYVCGNKSAKIDAKVHVGGHMICPISIVMRHPALGEVLQMETDMTGGEGGWHAHPFPGPTQSWPWRVLEILRHIRGVKGLIQARMMEDMDRKSREKPANG